MALISGLFSLDHSCEHITPKVSAKNAYNFAKMHFDMQV